MLNKEQLRNNNNKYSSLIETLKRKAVAGGEECNGLPLEVEELPEVGIEGAFYKVVKTEEVNQLWAVDILNNNKHLILELNETTNPRYTLQVVDDFPNNPVVSNPDNDGYIHTYYIKNMNDIYVYYNNSWSILSDLMGGFPFGGVVSNENDLYNVPEQGLYVVSYTNTTTTLYLFENNEYMQVGDASLLPSGTIDITENGEIDVAKYEKANVNVDTSKPEQSKSATPTKNTQTILPDTGYVLNKVIVEPIPEEYIVPSGTKTITENGTYNVTEKASAVVAIPEKQIILQDKVVNANGTYSADEGYDGIGQITVEVAGGTNTESEEVAGLLGNTMTILDNSLATSLRTRVCQYASALVTVNLPNVTSIGTLAFYGCTSLVTVNLPKATSITSQSFYNCTKLKHADFGMTGSIAAQAFNGCAVLTELILRKTDSICTLSNANAVNNTAIGKRTGYIYVPSALIDTYKTATNWSTFAEQFRAIEDYPDICGG